MSNKHIKLLDILKSVNLKNIKKKEINYFKNKRILITGVSGIIGINLLFFFDALNNKKKTKIIIDGTFNTFIFSFVKKYFKKNKLTNFKQIDLSEKKLNTKKKYDFIFHCAGYGQPSKFLKFSNATYKLNSSTIMMLEKNLKKNGKFIYMSSTEIYSGNTKLCNENDIGNTTPMHPRSSYIESKKFGESYLINNNNNFLIYRVCLTYGPGVKLNDERVLNLLLLRSIKNKQIDIYGGLNQLRSNLYIDDAINMIIKSTVKYKRKIFNINNHKSFLKGSPKIIKISNKKILNAINYKISTSLKDGLRKTFSWYLNLIN